MKMKTGSLRLLSAFVISLFLTTVFAEQPPKKDEAIEVVNEQTLPTNIQELKSAIAQLIEEKNLPAVGIAMVDEDGPVWVGALGKANLEDDITADENSLFRIGSTSKMFVALSVLKLVEEGKLDLNDKVSELAPEIKFQNQWHETDPIRVVHLLEHTTGWDDVHLPEYALNDPTPLTLKQGLDFHPHSRTSRWKPGSRSSYCNAGPPVAAYIVEKITGKTFEEYVQENFFTPMAINLKIIGILLCDLLVRSMRRHSICQNFSSSTLIEAQSIISNCFQRHLLSEWSELNQRMRQK